jgi:hypothetical protein
MFDDSQLPGWTHPPLPPVNGFTRQRLHLVCAGCWKPLARDAPQFRCHFCDRGFFLAGRQYQTCHVRYHPTCLRIGALSLPGWTVTKDSLALPVLRLGMVSFVKHAEFMLVHTGNSNVPPKMSPPLCWNARLLLTLSTTDHVALCRPINLKPNSFEILKRTLSFRSSRDHK